MCEELPGLCEVSGTSFEHLLKLSVEGGHVRGCHAEIFGKTGEREDAYVRDFSLGIFKVIETDEDA